jgi:hypothetical protein
MDKFCAILALLKHFVLVSCGIGTEQKNSTSPFLPWMLKRAFKGLTALPLEMDYDQTTMGLPPVTSAGFLIANSFWQN